MGKSKDGENAKKRKKNTSLRLDTTTLKALKIRAVEEDTSVQSIVERLVDLYLANLVRLPENKK